MSCIIFVSGCEVFVEENWGERSVNMMWRLNEVCETRRKTGTVAECDGWREINVRGRKYHMWTRDIFS